MTRLAHSSDPGADNRGIEERTVFRLPMKLCSGLEWRRRPWSQTCAVAGPDRAVLENSFFATPLEAVMQGADLEPIVQHNVDGLFMAAAAVLSCCARAGVEVLD
jgi:hypothetical protein